ncbi:CsbD family protein [Dyella flava]|uniref:CsbD family protein n=1 Tax=Dyella flava TaxID=1920170 RepID=A0ABS2K4U7_9GAMM|nr:CsbD family protein [Dyella flava]MBM7126242.1 CsbD family protein [Dyella flava]GLQ48953.1 CsbD family protein [Dyella flava]
MNHDTISGQWKQLGGQIKKQWGKLTDDDLKVVEGNAQMLAGRLQERYGIAREEAERQVRDFQKDLDVSRQKDKPLSH